MSEHSKEPWRINVYTGASLHPSILIETSDGNGSIALIVCNANPRANAARIVACVNFCAGVYIETLTLLNQANHPTLQQICERNQSLEKASEALKSRAEQAEQKLAKAMKAQEWMRKNIRVDNDSARFTYLPAKAIKEAAEILNEKEGMLND